MNAQLSMLTMLAMAMSETEIVDNAIEALTEYKNELIIGKENPQIPMAQVAMLMLRFENRGKDPFQAMMDMQRKEKVCRTAKEMHDMVENEPEKSN